MTDISGRIALVTGGGSGIGRALAHMLAREGAKVVIVDILDDQAQTVTEEIISQGGEALAATCDVCERDNIEAVRQRVLATFGPVDLLFANAGATSLGKLTDRDVSEIDWMTAVNFAGVMHCLQVFLPDMVARQTGHVVATASMAGLTPNLIPHHVAYTAAKAGVIGMMFNLRQELTEANIGCTVLCPGAVATNINNTPLYRPTRFGGPQTETLWDEVSIDLSGLDYRPPAEIAEQVLIAVRENRPLVITDPAGATQFKEQYVDVVMQAFAEAEAFSLNQRDTHPTR